MVCQTSRRYILAPLEYLRIMFWVLSWRYHILTDENRALDTKCLPWQFCISLPMLLVTSILSLVVLHILSGPPMAASCWRYFFAIFSSLLMYHLIASATWQLLFSPLWYYKSRAFDTRCMRCPKMCILPCKKFTFRISYDSN